MQLPASFIHYIQALLGEEEAEAFLSSLNEEQPVSIRLNREKRVPHTLSEEVPWATEAYYLNHRLTFTFDPLFHAGCYYVQEASSMFVEQALRRYAGSEPLLMLDLCAAPGGKSTLVRSLLPEGSLLVANEVIRNRSQILAENLIKWGHPDVVVTNNDPADFVPLKGMFDVILTDVPCSGEGMFRKDEVAVSEWSEENVSLCWQRQRRILSDIWPCLKPGGLLIYSTCTFNTQEDEENVAWISDALGAEILPLDIPEDWAVTGNLLAGTDFPVYRFLPHKTKGEGFFMAVLRKEGVWEPTGEQPLAKKKAKNRGNAVPTFSKEQLAQLRTWLHAPDAYELLTDGNEAVAFSRTHLVSLSALRAALRVIHYGCPLAELKGRDLLPQHALAMSTARCKEAFPQAEVSYEQAIAYLRKEAVTLSAEVSRGYVLLTYKDIPLGFVKNIGNRANNLYPQEWRIRSGYLPEEIRVL